MERQQHQHRLFPKAILFVVVLVIAWAFFTYKNAKLARVTDFDSCVAAGYRVLETYPEQCITQDGRTFVREIGNINTNVSTDTNASEALCVNRCGDGMCQEVVCFATGCPCAETAASCEQDCSDTTGTVNDSGTDLTNEADCEARGGQWGQQGLLPEPRCNLPARDASIVCTDNNQCEGDCLAAHERSTIGTCSDYRQNFGCFSWFVDGKLQPVCVD